MSLTQLRRQIRHVGELGEIVGAMRSLSAIRARRAREHIDAIRSYTDAIGEGLSTALGLMSEATRRELSEVDPRGTHHLIVLGSEHGFAGQFNEALLERVDEVAAEGAVELGVVGSRLGSLAASRQLAVAWRLPMATRASAAVETARRIESSAFGSGEGDLAVVDVLFSRYREGGGVVIERERLFPVDLDEFVSESPGDRPLHYLSAEDLIEKLVLEFVLGELARVTMESFLAENTARLRAMHAAEENVEQRLETLRKRANTMRQEEVTDELLDIIVGVQALDRHSDGSE